MVQIKDYLLAVVVIGMVVSGVVLFINEQADNAGVVVDAPYDNSTFNRLDEVTNETNNIKTAIEQGSIVSVDGFTALFNGAISVLKLFLNIVFLPIDIILGVSHFLGLPDWFDTGIIAAIVIVVAFVILNAIMGRDKA